MLRICSVTALFFCLTVILQWKNGAYTAGFAGPDEPAHYVSGLMVHDYLHRWPPPQPVQFAEEFYFHYPEVSIGHWPPLFYLIQAVWMSLTPQSRASVIALMALLSALLALATYRFVRAEFGEVPGLFAGALVICLPLVRQYSSQVMAEVPVALLCLCAALSFGRYIETGKWQYSALFGFLASLAILTKGTGFAVVLVVLAIVPVQGFKWLARGSFWIAPATVVGLCGLWYAFTIGMARNGWTEQAGLAYFVKALRWNAVEIAGILGLGLLPLVAIGLAVQLGSKPTPVRGRWYALAALLVGVYLFQSFVPASLAQRHLLTAAAPLVIFLVSGTAWLARRVSIGGHTAKTKLIAFIATILAGTIATTFHDRKLEPGPFRSAVQDLLARSDLRDGVLLVCSQSYGEGRFIAELATREARPGHIVLRGSKMLADGDWSGHENTLLYTSVDDAMHFLDSIPVSVIVVHSYKEGPIHPEYAQMMELLERYSSVWQSIGTYVTQDPSGAIQEEVRVYRHSNRSGPRMRKIRIDLHRMLGRSIEK